MPNIEIKETEYYNCPYCHRIIPDYSICNCVKIYNHALEDFMDKLPYSAMVRMSTLKEIVKQLKR